MNNCAFSGQDIKLLFKVMLLKNSERTWGNTLNLISRGKSEYKIEILLSKICTHVHDTCSKKNVHNSYL